MRKIGKKRKRMKKKRKGEMGRQKEGEGNRKEKEERMRKKERKEVYQYSFLVVYKPRTLMVEKEYDRIPGLRGPIYPQGAVNTPVKRRNTIEALSLLILSTKPVAAFCLFLLPCLLLHSISGSKSLRTVWLTFCKTVLAILVSQHFPYKIQNQLINFHKNLLGF